MYLTGMNYCTRSGEQRSEGDFLIVFSDPAGTRELRCLVRSVRMRQCGHWMIGHVKICRYEIGLSGGFGNDGLPCELKRHLVVTEENGEREAKHVDIPAEDIERIWKQLTPMPVDLAERYWKADDGHNSVPGSVAGDIRKWALENLKELRKRIK